MPDFSELLNLNSMTYDEIMEKLNRERKEFVDLQTQRTKDLKSKDSKEKGTTI